MRACQLLLAACLAGLAGCVTVPGQQAIAPSPPGPPPKIGVLVPLTGTNATIGRDMLRGAQLALGPNDPQLDVRDTASTPAGAALASAAAVAAHDGVIIGPLTAAETAAAAAVANGTPMLAFTSDRQQAKPGVWVLGITPQQQVARLVAALNTAGKSRIAAALPDNAFGDALADGLIRATSQAGDPPPAVRRYPDGRPSALIAALRDVSDYANRRGPLDAALHDAQASGDPDALAQAQAQASVPVGPAPFDALLLGDSGPTLAQALAALPGMDVAAPDVRVVGPATWAREAASVGALSGAWYAAPDPEERGAFLQAFMARFGSAPPIFADIAYDAARAALAGTSTPGALTRPGGFNGIDGAFILRPDGTALRALAVFEIQHGKPQVVEPAPQLATGS